MLPLATNQRGGNFRQTACRRMSRGATAPAAMPTSIARSSRRAPDSAGNLRLQSRNELDRILAADRIEIGSIEFELLQVLHLAEPEIGIVRAIGDVGGRHKL